ncbi:MAG: queuosine salvage family protein, partial [Actinomycetota bacterium]|nr:queuosine salvage family protein [Actinomycetota bacterium]
MDELRAACAAVAARSKHVAVVGRVIAPYASSLFEVLAPEEPEPALGGPRAADQAAFWLTLDAINFGSGWFPTLRKSPGCSGYATIAGGVRARMAELGPWSARELATISTEELAAVLQQDPQHPLLELFALSLRALGDYLLAEHGGSFLTLATSTGGSAVALARRLGALSCFADTSHYDGIEVSFFKRAQIAAADLARAGVIDAPDLGGLTMFADNLVPHVLRLDGVLRFDPVLVARIEAEELIEHGSPEEVEIRACALHAVELIVAERPGSCAALVDQLLWRRG